MIDLTVRDMHQSGLRAASQVQTAPVITPQEAPQPLVLVIEDHAATQNVMTSVLHLQGYQVVNTANGREALEWLSKALLKGQRPGIILLDLFMPVMNGVDFLASLRTTWPNVCTLPPVILFTVDQNNHDDLACAEVIVKPFHIRDLLAKCQQLLS